MDKPTDTRPPSDKQLEYCQALINVMRDSQHIDTKRYQELYNSATNMSEMSQIIRKTKAIVDEIRDGDRDAKIW
mgnify:CR=1 FL=1